MHIRDLFDPRSGMEKSGSATLILLVGYSSLVVGRSG
jgi:hypothetical protein